MNLVAKEYCAAQLDNDGVLILSELAGAAAQLKSSLSVNPYDQPRFVRKLHLALTMSQTEKHRRMEDLRQHLART
jgi:trehalose-6-phosphate synthase